MWIILLPRRRISRRRLLRRGASVGFQALGDDFTGVSDGIAGDWEDFGDPAGAENLGVERISVGISDLLGGGEFVYFDDFVARGDYRDDRTTERSQFGAAEGARRAISV